MKGENSEPRRLDEQIPSPDRSWLWWVIFAVPLAFGVVGFFVPPAVGADASWGLWSWFCQQRGAPWNCYWNVDPSNIATDAPTFLACFTPGQYLIPALFTTMGMSMRHAVVATTLACTLAGLLGTMHLFRYLGISERASLLACGSMTGSYWVTYSFNTYPGGEVLLFGISPWLVLWTLRLTALRSGTMLLLPLLFLAAAFMKLSAAPLVLSLIVGLLLVEARQPGEQRVKSLLRSAALYLLLFAAFYGALTCLHTSRGWTAAHDPFHFAFVTEKALFALGAPLGSALSFFHILNRLVFHPEGLQSALGSSRSFGCLLLVAFISVPLTIAILRHHWDNVTYSSVTLGITATMIGVIFVLTQGAVYVEERHFRLMGILLLPGAIELAMAATQRVVRYATGLIILFAFSFGLSSWVAKVRRNEHAPRVGGFAFLEADHEVVEAVEALDTELSSGNNLFYFPMPEWLSMIQSNRAAAPHNDSIERTFFQQAQRFHGTVDNLVIIIPAAMALDDRAARVAEGFPDMSGWRKCPVGAYVFLHAGQHTLQGWPHAGDLTELPKRPPPLISPASVGTR